MLKDDVINLLNMVFERAKLPYKLRELFIYRPVYHEPPFEGFEPVNDAKRLSICESLFLDINFAFNNHWFEYHMRFTRQSGRFSPKVCWLKYSDLYPKEDPKQIEKNMESNAEFIGQILVRALDILCKGNY